MNPLAQHEQSLIRGSFLSLFGGFAQQNPRALISFNRLLNAHNFDTIIECGTHTGGLSLLFAFYCYMSRRPAVCDNPNEPSLFVNRTHHRSPKSFYTYDIVVRDQTAAAVIEELGGVFEQRDTLTDQTSIDHIKEIVSNPASGTVLFLCDGGNKKREMELYSPALKPGDFIMCHDWAYDQEAFEKNKREGIWGSWETRWRDGEGPGEQFGIKDICEKNGVEQVYAEEFNEAVWFCGGKK